MKILGNLKIWLSWR